MGTIIFTLKGTLEEVGATMNAVAVEAKIRPATISDLVNGRSKSVNFETLTAIVDALNRLSKEKGKDKVYGLEDIFKYEDAE